MRFKKEIIKEEVVEEVEEEVIKEIVMEFARMILGKMYKRLKRLLETLSSVLLFFKVSLSSGEWLLLYLWLSGDSGDLCYGARSYKGQTSEVKCWCLENV